MTIWRDGGGKLMKGWWWETNETTTMMREMEKANGRKKCNQNYELVKFLNLI